MKVRARVKAPDYLPDWAKCCEEGWRVIDKAQGREMVVDLDIQVHRGCFCLTCGKGAEDTIGVYVERDFRKEGGDLYPLEWLDLDEGPMEATV